MNTAEYDRIIDVALLEDLPEGDITSESIVPADAFSKAIVLAKDDGVLAGMPVVRRLFERLDEGVKLEEFVEDGQRFNPGDTLARLEGRTLSLLKGERTALNFLQRLSGIATATRRFVEATHGTKTKILDTRKTTPGLRSLEKYAVKMGGGTNHRHSLSDMVLIKDNHLRYVGDIAEAVRRAREEIRPGIRIEVEVTTRDEAKTALASGVDIIMLDNMPLDKVREVVDDVAGRVLLEVSGKVDLDNVAEIAATGVDYISVGALTHSVKSVDISLEFLEGETE